MENAGRRQGNIMKGKKGVQESRKKGVKEGNREEKNRQASRQRIQRNREKTANEEKKEEIKTLNLEETGKRFRDTHKTRNAESG